MGKRTPISKKTRFEVFKRDSFTCQYCGKSAPEVVLEIDHIHPVAKGGGNSVINLVTACRPCNAGKGARKLNDHSVTARQVDQLKELQERREQIEMLAQWRQGLLENANYELSVVENYLRENHGITLSEYGRKTFSKDLRRFGLDDIITAIDKSADQYLIDPESDGDRAKFLDYIPRICYWQKRERENPVETELRRLSYTARKLWFRCNPSELAFRLIHLHMKDDVPVDVLASAIRASSGIMQFEDRIQEFFDEDDNGEN